jgi:hypothetical protein
MSCQGNPLFSVTKDQELFEAYNREIYELYYHPVDIYRLNYTTSTVDRFYHEDVNYTIPETPSYSLPGYVNVSDNGLAALHKAGQQIERQLFLYFSITLMKATLEELGLNGYTDVPTDGDVVKIQDLFWDIITVDPEGYHSNQRRFPFDYQCLIQPWRRDLRRPRKKKR